MGDMNVQLVMEAMGGGGHLTMAGAQIKDATVEQVRSQLIEILRAGIGRGTIQKK
jgi:c-di-AMP phosphodiesterase-like protein